MECGACSKTLNADEEHAYQTFKEMCPYSSQDCICVKCIDEESENQLLINSKQ